MKEDYKNMKVRFDIVRRSDYQLTFSQNYYQMGFDQGMILDATKGSVSRFVNHSCEPNCKMLKRFVEGQPRIALFVGDRGILTGEELTYDYNFK
jgi:histone-lysine N-methyltransferase ASH1L